MTAPKKLSRARNGAAYPTLKEAGLDRRFLLASVGAAALAVGINCSTQGAPTRMPWDAAADTGTFVGADGGDIVATDAGLRTDAGEGDHGTDPDGGAEGADT